MSQHIVILGAGISGLTLGWYLKQSLGSNLKITILEKEHRVGGWIQTIQSDGFLFEQGPHACRTGRETLSLIEELGLQDQVLVPHPNANKRYIYKGNGLYCLPKNLWEIPFNSLTKGWMGALWRDLKSSKCSDDDESIYAFFSRHIGIKWTENIIDPLISGIYAGDCKRLSLKSCFPLLDQWEGSLLRFAMSYRTQYNPETTQFIKSISRYPLFSFKEGMETLPKTLYSHLKENIKLTQKIKKISLFPNKIDIQFDNETYLHADYLISTIPYFALAPLLGDYDGFDQLGKVNYASIALINMGYLTSPLKLQGYGYLLPSKLQSLILGGIWNSCVFPQHVTQPSTSLTMMLGGMHHPECEESHKDELVNVVIRGLHEQLKIKENPSLIKVKIIKKAIPQFEIGYTKWKNRQKELVDQYSTRLFMSGSFWSGVSINDCIKNTQQLAHQILNLLHN